MYGERTEDRLVEDLLASVSGSDFKTRRLLVGPHWTVVESRMAGMAHTYRTSQKPDIEGVGKLVGRTALEVASRLRSPEPLEASLGLAALNSLIVPQGRNRNALEIILQRAPGKTVTVVGRFPFNSQVVAAAREVFILEIDPLEGELPASAAPEVIPRSDMVVITATAIINKSISRLLELSQTVFTVVLGPSTPLNDVLFDYGADLIAGVRVTDPDALISSVSQGAKSFRTVAGIEPVVRTKSQ